MPWRTTSYHQPGEGGMGEWRGMYNSNVFLVFLGTLISERIN